LLSHRGDNISTAINAQTALKFVVSEMLLSVTGKVFDEVVELRRVVRLDESVHDAVEGFSVIKSHAQIKVIESIDFWHLEVFF
jgi:ABC-type proline/glycine betaine transport system substrate-binding protein